MASSDNAGAVAGMDCVVLHQICEGDKAVALGERGSGVCLPPNPYSKIKLMKFAG